MPDQKEIGHLEGLIVGIKEAIDRLDGKLDQINGRVRKNEQEIAKGKGIVLGISAVFGAIGGFIGAFFKGWLDR